MTETTEVPALELDAATKAEFREWLRVLARDARRLANASQVRPGERIAWSKTEAAKREYEKLQQQADPAVRAMTAHEQAEWAQRHQRPDRDPAAAYTRRANLPTGTFSVTVEPCLQRWGLHAHGTTPDGRPVEALISCATQAIATGLANAVAEKGAPAVGRLRDYTVHSAERAAAARSELRETHEQQLARTAVAVHEVWSGPLAEAITGAPAPGYNLTTSPAFEALARRLHGLEERGYTPTDVLRAFDPERLRAPTAKNPAAMATSFVKKQQDRLLPINLDGPGAATRAAGRGAPGPDDEEIETSTAVDDILARSLTSDDLRALRDDDNVRRTVQALYSEGLRVEGLLRDLPVEKVLAANHPGHYLAGVVEGRAEHLRPSPTGVDHGAMAALVHGSLVQPVADKVVNCRAWPGLAGHLESWQQRGMPVDVMLESLPVSDIAQHSRPAMYTRNLMYEKVDEYLAWIDARRRTAEALAAEATSPGHDRGPGPTPARADARSSTDPTNGDPTSADRSGVDPGDRDIEALVENVIAQARQHADAAADAEARVAQHEHDATRNRAAPDRPDTDRRGDHIGDDDARVDDRAAAAERATAAEQRGAATAAAARAELTYTPDTTHEPNTETGQHTRPSTEPPVPNRARTQAPSRERRR